MVETGAGFGLVTCARGGLVCSQVELLCIFVNFYANETDWDPCERRSGNVGCHLEPSRKQAGTTDTRYRDPPRGF